MSGCVRAVPHPWDWSHSAWPGVTCPRAVLGSPQPYGSASVLPSHRSSWKWGWSVRSNSVPAGDSSFLPVPSRAPGGSRCIWWRFAGSLLWGVFGWGWQWCISSGSQKPGSLSSASSSPSWWLPSFGPLWWIFFCRLCKPTWGSDQLGGGQWELGHAPLPQSRQARGARGRWKEADPWAQNPRGTRPPGRRGRSCHRRARTGRTCSCPSPPSLLRRRQYGTGSRRGAPQRSGAISSVIRDPRPSVLRLMRGALIYTWKGRLVRRGQSLLAYPTTAPAGSCLGKPPPVPRRQFAPHRSFGAPRDGHFSNERPPKNWLRHLRISNQVCEFAVWYGNRKRGSGRARTTCQWLLQSPPSSRCAHLPIPITRFLGRDTYTVYLHIFISHIPWSRSNLEKL